MQTFHVSDPYLFETDPDRAQNLITDTDSDPVCLLPRPKKKKIITAEP